ncbi:MAG TPA: DUF4124 domain-containing protein [Pinirhizobacter sp.]|uniref:DUF4124 domain-containing protein n=1 Tax=Pinirhizobacter sp. TaxID=2950432 RepID=UPI002B864733|nr:DUF4124 domain-containing protein [Pinirhizobacter sp.]HMH67121.1 DUF4124 domain-containing protein [Pinirhizobacter sp.]
MHRSFRLALSLALCAATTLAFAQKGPSFRFKWKDGAGLAHYSDTLTTDAMKYGYEVVNDAGMVVQHVDRQLTPEELAAAKRAADAKAVQDTNARAQRQADVQMLAAYPDEATFTQAKQAEMDSLDQTIHTTQGNLSSQEKALTDLLQRAGDLERANQPVPKALNDRIAEQRTMVSAIRSTLERQQANRANAQLKMEGQVRHYRELRKAQQEQNPAGQ